MTPAKHDGKTSVWFRASTKAALLPYMTGGETWDGFLIRVMVELRKNKKPEGYRTVFEKDDKKTTIWLNKTTVKALNSFRQPKETWGLFFERVASTLKETLSKNPNC